MKSLILVNKLSGKTIYMYTLMIEKGRHRKINLAIEFVPYADLKWKMNSISV
jgi:hypothetical protein